MDYGVILASTPTTLTRAVIIDGKAVVQHFTAPVEIPMGVVAAEEVLGLAEQAEEDTRQEAAAGDAYLAKIVREEHEMACAWPPVRLVQPEERG